MAQAETFRSNHKKLEAAIRGDTRAARDVFGWLLEVYQKGCAGKGKRDTSVRPFLALVWYTLTPEQGTQGGEPPVLASIPATRHREKLLLGFDGKDEEWKKAVEVAITEGWLVRDPAYREGEVWIRHRSRVDAAHAPPKIEAPRTKSSSSDASVIAAFLVMTGGLLAPKLKEYFWPTKTRRA